MKQFGRLILLLTIFLGLIGCAAKNKAIKASKNEERLVKTQVFEMELASGQKQRQTVVYKGKQIQKLILQNGIPKSEEVSKALAEVGVEETKRLIMASMKADDSYKALDETEGLDYDLQFDEHQNMSLIFTMTVPQLDTERLTKIEMFKGAGLEDIKTIEADKYLLRLETYGAKPITEQTQSSLLLN